ncbi:hypothetical protein P9112_004051 [Eukaryota sp. TZLM1-RC]
MDWSERDYGYRWIDFMLNIGRVLTRSTAIQDVRGLTQQMRHITIHGNPVDRLPEWKIASHVIESIGITIIRDRLLRIWSNPSHYYSDGHTLGEFFSVLQIEYENFCNARSFKEQINHVDFLYQNRISFQTENCCRQTVPSPPAIPKPRGSSSGRRPNNNDEKEALLNRLPLSLIPTSNAISVNKWVIRLKGALVRTAKEAKSGESNKLNIKLEAEVLEVLVSVVEEALAAEAEALHHIINVPVTIYAVLKPYPLQLQQIPTQKTQHGKIP